MSHVTHISDRIAQEMSAAYMLGAPDSANLSIVRTSCTHLGGVSRWLQASHVGSGATNVKPDERSLWKHVADFKLK